jgi:type II secretory pathway component PulC
MLRWRPYAPLAASAVLTCLLAWDLSHTVWALHDISGVRPPAAPAAAPTRPPEVDVRQIVNGHLFGETVVAIAAVDPEHAPDTKLPLALKGVVATTDPHGGYAILGPAEGPTHLYRTGATLEEVDGGRLQEVYVDRVVLELDGNPQILRLPRRSLFAGQGSGGDTSVAQTESRPAQEQDPDVITPAEGFFASLNVEQTNVGESAALVMHPAKRFQRQYGLRDSDVLTAVDGVDISDAQTLAGTLRTNAKSLSLTFVRDGIPRTVRLSMAN